MDIEFKKNATNHEPHPVTCKSSNILASFLFQRTVASAKGWSPVKFSLFEQRHALYFITFSSARRMLLHVRFSSQNRPYFSVRNSSFVIAVKNMLIYQFLLLFLQCKIAIWQIQARSAFEPNTISWQQLCKFGRSMFSAI